MFGCTRTPGTIDPTFTVPQTFAQSGTSSVPEKWWTVFENDELNRLVQQSTGENFDLLLAWERLQAAEALLKRESSARWPGLNARLKGQLQDPTPNSGNSWGFGLIASYEVDLWGGIRSAIEAERFRRSATEAEYQTAVLTVSAEIVRTYLQLLTARTELDLVNTQLEINRKIFGSLQARFGAGQGERADLLRQAQLVEATLGQVYVLEAEVNLLENQLAVLVGRMPGQLDLHETSPWPELPDLPKLGLPADLLQRRPDIISNFNRLKAADQELAVAVSETYPGISIIASANTEDDDFSEIFEDWIYSLAGNALMPLFDAGQRRSEVERSEAIRNQALYAYSQSVLEAVTEVEDALILEKRQSRRLQSLQEQVRLARESHQQLQLQYINGASDFLDVLTALTNEQRLRRDLLAARLDLYESRIALYRAIAGPIVELNQPEASKG